MPDFLNTPIIIGLILTLVASLFLLKGYQINSNKSTDKVLSNGDSNKDEIISEIRKSQEIIKNIINDDFTGALMLFNSGDLTVKKGVILDLKNKAISDINQRQQILDFLCSLNDWVTDNEEYSEILKKVDIEWTKWKMEKDYLKKGDKVFEKEKQIISIEASNAIDEIIYEHIKTATTQKLTFNQKNLLGLLFADYDFKHNNIDFSQANLFGAYFLGAKNINQTNFIYATYYGSTLFRDVILPEIIYVNHELGTEYNGDVHFMNVQFPEGVNLTNSYFKENVHFVNCVFQKNAVFYISTFMKETRFFRCTFNSEASFNSATFNGKTSFENSAFNSKTQFVTVNFNGETNFKGATFKIEPEFGKTKTENIINLN